MEIDLTNQAVTYMKENFVEKLDEASIHNLTQWLSSQLEKERTGWKLKVQDALQEVDRERKHSLHAFAQLEHLNSRLEMYMNRMTIYREASMYAAVESDEKEHTLEHLAKNIDSILRRLHQLLEERSECIKVLSFNKKKLKNLKLQDLVRNYANHYEEKLADAGEISRQEFSKLTRKLNCQERESRDMQQRSSEVQERLEREISRLRNLLMEQKEDFLTETVSELTSKGVQVEKADSFRDCCIQVELDLDKRFKQNLLQIEPSFSIDVCHNVFDVNSENHCVQSDYHVSDKDSGNESLLPKLALVPNGHGNSPRFSNGLKCQPFALQSRNGEFNSDEKDADVLKDKVSDLAFKLKRTQRELDTYEQQLTAMKIGFTNKPTANLSKSPRSTRSLDSVKLVQEDGRELNGYLSGIPQEIIFPREKKFKSPESLYLHSHFRKSRGQKGTDKEKGFVTSSVTTKCLRCHKVYTVRDNHKMACRYHPKGKKKIEKYDEKGKLVMVNFIWECCMQKPEAWGCSAGEHI